MASIEKLLQRYLDYCTPCGPIGVWSGLGLVPDCFACPENGPLTLAWLGDDFLEDTLLSSGIAKNPGDGLELNPALVGPSARVVALRTEPAQLPYALLTSAGVLSGRPRKPLEVLDDHWTKGMFTKFEHGLSVAFTVPHLIVLRGLGLPATVFGDLLEPTPKDIAQLAVRCRWTRQVGAVSPDATDDMKSAEKCSEEHAASVTGECPGVPHEVATPAAVGTETGTERALAAGGAAGDDGGNTAPPSSNAEAVDEPRVEHFNQPAPKKNKPPPVVTLIFTAWSIAELEYGDPSELLLYAEKLLTAARYLDFNVHSGMWQPEAETLQRIRFCLEADLPAKAIDALQESVYSDRFDLEACRAATSESATERFGLLKALDEYGRLLRDPAAGRKGKSLDEGKRKIENAIDHDIIQPLITAAQSEEDPQARNICFLQIALSRRFHRAALLEPDTAPKAGASPSEMIRFAQNNAMIIKLAKAIFSCNREARA